MPALATYELTKDYAVGFWKKRPYRALDSLTLRVEPGEVFGFLGPNGAGKTTTLKLLMQLVFPTSGDAEILGRPAGDVGVRRRIGYLPENPYFYDYLTAEELLDPLGVDARGRDPRAEAVEREDQRGEEDAPPELGHAPRVREPAEHLALLGLLGRRLLWLL